MEFKLIFCAFFVTLVAAQVDPNTKDEIDTIFSSPPPRISDEDDFIPGFEQVIDQKGTGDLGPIQRCGEGSDRGIHVCVPYHKCDAKTKTVVEEGVTDGFGLIDIRFGDDKPCTGSYLDVCCRVPAGGLQTTPKPAVPFDPSQETLPPPYTDPPIGFPPNFPVTPAPAPSFCGIRNENGIDFKITGNKDNEAEYGEFPWMVAIIKQGVGTDFICGGSLITPNVVLTGAHCVNKYTPGNLKVRVGEWDSQTTRERLPYQERDISQIILHEQFNNGNLFNDVALLILTRNVKQAENVGTVCLPVQNEVVISRNCYISGWGKDVFGKQGILQTILKKIELPVVPKPQCQNALRQTRLGGHFKLDESFMCAGGEGGKDACTGDGGSPLVCPDPHNPQRYVQVGIVAWGIGCGEQGIPGVYADVGRFRQWIDRHMERLQIDTLPYNN